MLQAAQVIPDGPAWLAALAISLPAIAGAVKLGASIVRPGSGEGKANGESTPAVEFRVDTRGRLDRLTEIAAKQAETSEQLGRILAGLDRTLTEHDKRATKAGEMMGETARQIAQMHRMIVSDP